MTAGGDTRRRIAYKRAVLTPRRADDPRQRIWSSMRVLRTFRVSDLETVTELKRNTIQSYLQLLAIPGYIRQINQAGGHLEKVWQLVRNTGPEAPRASRQIGITDANTGKAYDLTGAEVLLVHHSLGATGRDEVAP